MKRKKNVLSKKSAFQRKKSAIQRKNVLSKDKDNDSTQYQNNLFSEIRLSRCQWCIRYSDKRIQLAKEFQ